MNSKMRQGGLRRWFTARRMRALGVAVAAGCWTACAGCAASGEYAARAAAKDPEAMLRGEGFTTGEKDAAIDSLWAQGPTREAARERLKQIAWAGRYPRDVRVSAARKLAADAQDIDAADTRAMLMRLIATEPDQYYRWDLAKLVAERGWTDLAPALAISFAQWVDALRGPERAEYKALAALFPGRTVERTLFEVFVTPVPAEITVVSERQRHERGREAAWSVLARLDGDGSARGAMLAESGAAGRGDPLVDAVRAAVLELGAVPISSSEVRWAQALRDFGAAGTAGAGAASDAGPARRERWSAVAAAVAGLTPEQRAGLRLRHSAAIAWAAARGELLRESAAALRQRLASRIGSQGGSSDPKALASLAWGELLTILMLDECVSRADVRGTLGEQITRDTADRTTEHGGLLFLTGDASRPVEARVYPPRPLDRRSDREFVAPPEMFQAETLAIAHYHFHAERVGNREYAGPGLTDRRIADLHGRANLVITSVGAGKMNVVYYAAGGIVVNLGDRSAK